MVYNSHFIPCAPLIIQPSLCSMDSNANPAHIGVRELLTLNFCLTNTTNLDDLESNLLAPSLSAARFFEGGGGGRGRNKLVGGKVLESHILEVVLKQTKNRDRPSECFCYVLQKRKIVSTDTHIICGLGTSLTCGPSTLRG
jgi:hypothetical protein